METKIKKGSADIPDAFALRFVTADANMLQLLSLSAHLEDDVAKIHHLFQDCNKKAKKYQDLKD